MAREAFAIASMVVAAAALIGLFDFIDRNIDETLTLGEAWGDVPHVPPEAMKNPSAEKRGGTGATGRGDSVRSNHEGTPNNSRPLGTGI